MGKRSIHLRIDSAERLPSPAPSPNLRFLNNWLCTQAGISIDVQLLPSSLAPITKLVLFSFCTNFF